MGRKYIYFKLFEFADSGTASDQFAQFEIDKFCHAPEKIETVFQLYRFDNLKRILEKSTNLQRALSIHSADRQLSGFLWSGELLPGLNILWQEIAGSAEIFIFQHIAEPELTLPSAVPQSWLERYQVFNWNVWRLPTAALVLKLAGRLGENPVLMKTLFFAATQRADYLMRRQDLQKVILSALHRGSENAPVLFAANLGGYCADLPDEMVPVHFLVQDISVYLQMVTQLYHQDEAMELDRACRFLNSQLLLLKARDSQNQGELFAGLLKNDLEQYQAGHRERFAALTKILDQSALSGQLINIFYLLDVSIRQKFPDTLAWFHGQLGEALSKYRVKKRDETFTTFFLNLLPLKLRELRPVFLKSGVKTSLKSDRLIVFPENVGKYSGLMTVFPFEAEKKTDRTSGEVLSLLTGWATEENDVPGRELILSELLLGNGHFNKFGGRVREILHKLFMAKYPDQVVFIYQQVYRLQKLLNLVLASNPAGLRVAIYFEQRFYHIRGSFADIDWAEIAADTVTNPNQEYPLTKQVVIGEPESAPAVYVFVRPV